MPQIGVKGRVYDVSSAASFYGPGQSYSLFAGHDASRALAKSTATLVARLSPAQRFHTLSGSLEKEDVENTDVSDLTPRSLTVLDNWVRKYQQKYICVGYIKKEEAAEAPQPTTS